VRDEATGGSSELVQQNVTQLVEVSAEGALTETAHPSKRLIEGKKSVREPLRGEEYLTKGFDRLNAPLLTHLLEPEGESLKEWAERIIPPEHIEIVGHNMWVGIDPVAGF
jgi:hypothetical protein